LQFYIGGKAKKLEQNVAMYIRLDTIPAWDGQTDRRTDGRNC